MAERTRAAGGHEPAAAPERCVLAGAPRTGPDADAVRIGGYEPGGFRDGPPDPVVESVLARIGDRIDDRVAAAFDEQEDERRGAWGLLDRSRARERRTGTVVLLASAALGTLTTVAHPGGTTDSVIPWAGLAVLNLGYFFRRSA